jgi:riboflavin transporter FmnP
VFGVPVAVVVVAVVMVVDYYYFQAPLFFQWFHQELCIPCFLLPVSFLATDSDTRPFH